MPVNKKHMVWIGIVLLLGSIAAIWFLWLRDIGKPRPVTIGIQSSPAMALVMVAKDRGMFDDEGIQIELKEFTAGKFALQAFLAGSIDFSVSGEVPACLAALQGHDFCVVTQVVEKTVNEVRVVALKDGDLIDPKAYFKAKKRRLSTSFGGGPEMFTYSFLKHHGIGPKDIEIISQKPEDMPVALEAGSVDAIAIFDPFAFIAEKRMGNKAQTFADARLYSELYVLNASRRQVADQPEVIERILRALVRAGKFIDEHPDEAKQITQKYTKLDRDVIDGIWGNFVFRPALTPQLLDYWEMEAAWAKETNVTKADAKAPNFHGMIEASMLKKVAPEAVKIP